MNLQQAQIPESINKIIDDQIEAYPLTEEDRELHRTKLKLFAEFGYRLAISQPPSLPDDWKEHPAVLEKEEALTFRKQTDLAADLTNDYKLSNSEAHQIIKKVFESFEPQLKETLKSLKEALDACFVVMMQPGWLDTLEGGKKFSVYDIDSFVEARGKAERMYYELLAPPSQRKAGK